MNVTVMNRDEAVRYCNQEHENKTIMISISDPYMIYQSKPRTTKKNNVVSVLYLEFCDADRPGKDVYGREITEKDMMSNADAKWVASFVKGNPGLDVIVHCDAGVSRSAGLAAAILKWANGDDSAIFDSPRYYPNMWAYRKTLTALTEK